MAEQQGNDQERTEEPTPKRVREAREKGQVARSRELTMTAVMLAGAGFIFLGGAQMARAFAALFHDALDLDRTEVIDADRIGILMGELAGKALLIILPVLLLSVVVAVLSSGLLGGWNFSRQAIAPKFSRMSPAKGLKRVFGAQGLMELVKAMAKFAVVGTGGMLFLWASFDGVLGLSRLPVVDGMAQSALFTVLALLIVSAVLIVIAGIDVPFQLSQHHKQLRMTRQEVQDELKQTEGRPEVKSKLRNLQQQRAGRRMMQEVPDADVVVNNPTHFSVALRYDASSMDAPVVVAKGADAVARVIREIAEAHQVPQLEAPLLARSLYAGVDLGQRIPPHLYAAVAEVLAWVHRLRNLEPGDSEPDPPTPAPPEPDSG